MDKQDLQGIRIAAGYREWRPIKRPPRVRSFSCSVCGRMTINETNILRREGWQETANPPHRYRCGDCSPVETTR